MGQHATQHGVVWWVAVVVSAAAAAVGAAGVAAAVLGAWRGLEWRAYRMRNVAVEQREDDVLLVGEEEGIVLGGPYAPLPTRSTL